MVEGLGCPLIGAQYVNRVDGGGKQEFGRSV